MHYQGSKYRHAAEIIAVTCKNRKVGSTYVEPFVGGGNVICRVPPAEGLRIGADKNKYMVALLDAVGNRGWLPPEIMTEAEWRKIKKQPDKYPSELVAFAATGPTFGSVWWGPWAKDDPERGKTRYQIAREAAARDCEGLRGVKFLHASYDELEIPPESIVYCDPPYAETGDYRKGDHVKITVGDSLAKNGWRIDKFWRWADKMVDGGHHVFVSEYRGPQPSTYDVMDQTLKDEDRAICILGKVLDERKRGPSSNWPTPEECEVLFARRRALDALESKERARLAARWQVVWQKEIGSRWQTDRPDKTEGAVELLFHRSC